MSSDRKNANHFELEQLRKEVRQLRERDIRWRQLETELQATLSDLSVHQEELRSQNEELRSAHDEIERSHRKYLDLFNFAPIGIVSLDEQGLIADVNETMAQLLHRDKRYLKGKPFVLYLAGDFHDIFFGWLSRTFRGVLDACEVRMVSQAGMFWASLHGAPQQQDINPRLCHIAVIDIERRRNAEDALRRSERRFRSIIERTPSGVCITDEHGIFEYVNQAYCDIYRYKPEELIGNSFTLIVPEELQGQLQELHDRYICGEEEVQGEWEVRRKDDSRLTILADAARITGMDGRTKKATFITDITERKQAEQLRSDVERMTRHDLKGPLQGIIGLPGIIKEETELDEEHEYMLTLIEEAGERMLNTINLSLDLFRIEMGQYDFDPVPVSIVGLVEKAAAEVRLMACSSTRTVTVRTPSDGERGNLWSVMAEELLCRNMLINLIKNAVEAAPRGENVDVEFSRGGGMLCVAVSNPGEVPLQVRDSFFEKYSSHGKKQGTGLGTYLAMQITKTHKGSITLNCDTPGFTTVTVCLPQASAGRIDAKS